MPLQFVRLEESRCHNIATYMGVNSLICTFNFIWYSVLHRYSYIILYVAKSHLTQRGFSLFFSMPVSPAGEPSVRLTITLKRNVAKSLMAVLNPDPPPFYFHSTGVYCITSTTHSCVWYGV